MFFALLALALSQSSCGAPPGVSDVLHGSHRYVIVGETHGSVQAPAAFAGIVCEAARRGPIRVAVELPQSMQSQLDVFLGADGDVEAMAALAGTPFMDPAINDGRTSRAMLDMLQSVRRLRVSGSDIALVAFQPSTQMPSDLPQSYYEVEMGYLLSRAAVVRPHGRIMVLVGNVHASKTSFANLPEVGLPAAAHLPPGDVLSLAVVRQGGQTWSCRQHGCGPSDVGLGYEADARGIIMTPYREGAYDGVLALGPATASPPVSMPEGP